MRRSYYRKSPSPLRRGNDRHLERARSRYANARRIRYRTFAINSAAVSARRAAARGGGKNLRALGRHFPSRIEPSSPSRADIRGQEGTVSANESLAGQMALRCLEHVVWSARPTISQTRPTCHNQLAVKADGEMRSPLAEQR